MEITASGDSTMAMAASAQQLQTSLATQVEMLQELAQAQMEVATMLTEMGVGANLDVLA